MIRPGIAVYGYQPSDEMHTVLPLRPCLKLTSILMQIKDLTAGASVGYGLTHTFDRATRVGLVPVGYADGYPRSLSGKVSMRIAGVDVVEGVLAEECRMMNRGFLSRVERKRPWVTLKAAASLDGNMALASGESKWISNHNSRTRGHILRACHDAIMVGVGTVVKDDPFLTVREVTGKTSRLIVMDPDFRTPPDSHITEQECIICGFLTASNERKKRLSDQGCRILEVKDEGTGVLSIPAVLELLAGDGINYLLVEGGPTLLGHFFLSRLFDSVSIFYKPAFRVLVNR